MSIGIYKITNIINDKSYIGQSTNIKQRWKTHKYLLNTKKHYNSHLQNAWDKYGEKFFYFQILKCCKEQYLNRFEKMYIKQYNSIENGYNLNTGGRSNWKNIPTIIKKGKTYSGQNYYAIRYKGKIIKSSINKEFLNKYLHKHYDEIINNKMINDEQLPKIIKYGHNSSGNRKYAIYYERMIIKSSVNKNKLKNYLEKNFNDITNGNMRGYKK